MIRSSGRPGQAPCADGAPECWLTTITNTAPARKQAAASLRWNLVKRSYQRLQNDPAGPAAITTTP